MLKDEKTYLVRCKGVSPLIMHNSECADPENHWSKKMAPLKAKRKKTEQDHKEIRDLSFLSSLYWSEELNGLYMPVENVQKMLLEAGRGCDQRGAKKQFVGLRFDEYLGFPLEVKNRDNIEKLKADPALRYFKIVTISKAKVGSIRAIFKDWAFEFKLKIDCSIINPSTAEEWIVYAGDRIGLGARRPYAPTPGAYGRFYLDKFEQVKG